MVLWLQAPPRRCYISCGINSPARDSDQDYELNTPIAPIGFDYLAGRLHPLRCPCRPAYEELLDR